MRTSSASAADHTSTVIPAAPCNAPDDVASVSASSGYKLFARFNDGTSGTVDMAAIIHSPTTGVFAELADKALFANVDVVLGAVTWTTGQDLAPDAMYAAFRRDGLWVLS